MKKMRMEKEQRAQVKPPPMRHVHFPRCIQLSSFWKHLQPAFVSWYHEHLYQSIHLETLVPWPQDVYAHILLPREE